jgi:hypothetical protein
MPDPLPRKVDVNDYLALAHVHPECVRIWKAGRDAGRRDTFIGLIRTDDWTLFLAPCFGLDDAETQVPRGDAELKADWEKKISIGEFDKRTRVVGASSTATETSTRIEATRNSLEKVYGTQNVCYVKLDPKKGFDGVSHQSFSRWVNHKFGIDDPRWWSAALGFGIQVDRTGYFVRFASTLNQKCGQNPGGGDRFQRRMSNKEEHQAREPRDLPKQWALLTERILARDLELALHEPEKKFERMRAQGDEKKTTKLRRFDHRYQPDSETSGCTMM